MIPPVVPWSSNINQNANIFPFTGCTNNTSSISTSTPTNKTIMPTINYQIWHFWSACNMSHMTAVAHKFRIIRVIVEWRVSDHNSVNISQLPWLRKQVWFDMNNIRHMFLILNLSWWIRVDRFGSTGVSEVSTIIVIGLMTVQAKKVALYWQ